MSTLKNWANQIINISQKYLKTDVRYILSGGFWLIFGQIASTLFSFGLSIGFAHFLSKESFGTYKYILSVAGLLGAFTLTGLNNAVIQTVARGNEAIINDGYRISLKWSVFFVVGSFLGAIYYFLNDNLLLAFSMIVIGVFSPFLNSASIYSAYLQGKKDFKTNGLYGIIRGSLPAIALFVAILLTNNPFYIIIVYFASNTLIISLLYHWTVKKFKPNNLKDEQTIPFAKHSSIINIFSGISDKLDSILLFHFIGPIQVAIYTFATAIPENINGMIKNILPLAIPKFSENTNDSARKSVIPKMIRLTGILVVISALYILLTPFIFKYIFPKYIEAIFFSQIAGLSILINGTLPVAFFESQLAVKEKYILSVVSNVIKIPLLFIGAAYFGIMGIIVAKLLSKLVGLFTSIFLIKKMK
jgi:O-antigen/teichoic acid export membrane protein